MQFIDRHAYDWGAAFARALFPLFRKRRRIAVDNILKAGITDDPKEAQLCYELLKSMKEGK